MKVQHIGRIRITSKINVYINVHTNQNSNMIFREYDRGIIRCEKSTHIIAKNIFKLAWEENVSILS